MSPIILILNKNASKDVFDRIAIYKKSNDTYTVYYKSDVTNDTYTEKTPQVIVLDSRDRVLDYIANFVDLLHADIDTTPHHSIDVMVPGFPVVALSTTVRSNKDLLDRLVYFWTKTSLSAAS
jgi:hypothetical protein